jgi:DNA-binding transcriptional LysR family regulator
MDGSLPGLEVLAAVVATGSFVRAGERIGLTQSGVSRAVARLEERVGVRLFDRNARAVTLTDEGRRFHEEVSPLVAAIEDAFEAAARKKSMVRGRLRINVDPLFARDVLAPRLGEFLGAYPELELELVVRDHAEDFIAQGFDAALRFGEPREAGLIARRLAQTRIVTCASPAYLARMGRPRHPRELARGHECIQFRDPRTGRPFDWEFHRGRERVRVDVRGRLFVNDGDTGVRACVAGHGIAQPMKIYVEHLLRSGALVELFPRFRDELFPLYLMTPSRQHQPAKLVAFVEFVTKLTRAPGNL